MIGGGRIEGISWWKDEQIKGSDILRAVQNCNSNYHFDYIFTHCCPIEILLKNKTSLCDFPIEEELLDHKSEDRLQKLKDKITFNNWWFGHYHQDINLDDVFSCLYHGFKELR